MIVLHGIVLQKIFLTTIKLFKPYPLYIRLSIYILEDIYLFVNISFGISISVCQYILWIEFPESDKL